MSDANTDPTRRRVLQSLGAASATALAGCGGGQGDGERQTPQQGQQTTQEQQTTQQQERQTTQQELGERVPPVLLSWFGSAPRDPIVKNQVDIVSSNIKELGIKPDIQPMSTGSIANKFLKDQLDGDLPHVIEFPQPQRIDPHRLLSFVGMIEGVGAPVGPVALSQYASCEYRDLVFAQSTEVDREKRQELVTQALTKSTEDVACIPLTNTVLLNGIRTDKVEPRSVGKIGAIPENLNFYLNSSPKDGDSIVFQIKPSGIDAIQPTRVGEGKQLFNGLINSTLTKVSEDLEIENYVADSIELQDDGREIVVELVDGLTFHNGEPITAEDVKWSFEYVVNYPSGVIEILSWPHESIEVIDEKTVQFNQKFPSVVLPALNFNLIGIWHKESLVEAGATENPAQYRFSDPTDLVGSGPYQIDHAEPGSSLRLVPFDDHPVYSPDHNLIIQGFAEKQTAVQAFKGGELHTIVGLQPQLFKQLRQRDDVMGIEGTGWTQLGIYPQMSAAPSKFEAFRRAVSVSLNREKMNVVGQAGFAKVQLHGGPVPNTHPWFEADKVPNVAEDPKGDVEAARQILADAGWGWDENGNLHYPPDADLSRLWPKGEGPDPDDYPCLGIDENGNRVYVPPEER